MRSIRVLVSLFFVPLLVVACQGAAPEVDRAATPGPDLSTEQCPDAASAFTEGTVVDQDSADVDGDGEDNQVSLVRDEAGEPGCRTFLVVDDRLLAPTNDEDVEYGLAEPQLLGFAQVDGEGGLEVLVDLEQGASSRFAGLFTVADGAIERVEIDHPAAPLGLLPYGGSVGRVETTDCTETGAADLAISTASAVEAGYRIDTTLFEMTEEGLEPLPRAEQPPVDQQRDLASFDEFSAGPFASCSREAASE